MPISDHERLLTVFADELENGIARFFQQVDQEADWVDTHEEAQALMTRVRGIFIASLVGEIEEKIGRSFASIFEQLPDTPTLPQSKYWFVDMPHGSTPRGRAKVMWAIRTAYSHGNGKMNQIADLRVRDWAEAPFARTHFRGIVIRNDIVTLMGDVTYPALKTALEICDRFSPVSNRP